MSKKTKAYGQSMKAFEKEVKEENRIREIIRQELNVSKQTDNAKVEIPNRVTQEAMEEAREFSSLTTHQTILEKAKALVYGPRNKVYRHPSDNFDNIANLFNAYFNAIKVRPNVLTNIVADPEFRINNIDVAYLNILQKVARAATAQDHEDTLIDIAGYAACVERILKNV